MEKALISWNEPSDAGTFLNLTIFLLLEDPPRAVACVESVAHKLESGLPVLPTHFQGKLLKTGQCVAKSCLLTF